MIRIVKSILGRIKRHFEPTKNTWSIEKLTESAMDAYEYCCGYRFDINNPQTFSEKTIWYKLFYDNDNLCNVVDKYLFKSYIEEKLGPNNTIPLIGVWETIDDFEKDWDSLPSTFCLKSTLQSDGKNILFVKNKNLMHFSELKKNLKSWLRIENTLINSYCRGYYKCKPRIIAEEYKENIANQLFDYKFYCFNGNPYCICASTNHYTFEDYPITYYDLEWNKLNVKSGIHRIDDIPKPKHLDEMIYKAKVLSKGFPMVRVDFFDTDEGLYLAEMTFYPGGGYINYEPKSFNYEMGSQFILPLEDDIRKKYK